MLKLGHAVHSDVHSPAKVLGSRARVPIQVHTVLPVAEIVLHHLEVGDSVPQARRNCLAVDQCNDFQDAV